MGRWDQTVKSFAHYWKDQWEPSRRFKGRRGT